jgi:DNA-directed RNA polymerase subunit RPC12/RpoP
MNEDLIKPTAIIVFAIIFLVAALPFKNYLEIRKVLKKENRWMNWLREKPSKDEYCKLHNMTADTIQCDYCGTARQYPSLEMVITNEPKFGYINNSFNKYAHFKTYICSGCGTELFRERYVE